MSSSSRSVSVARAGALWLVVTAALGLLARLALPTVSGATRAPAAFADVLVAGCALAAVVASAWLWVLTTGVALDVLRTGPEVRRAAGPVRALLLVACGVAVLTAGTHPAHADPGSPASPGPGPTEPRVGLRHDSPLAGLPLPDRASGGEPREDRRRDEQRHDEQRPRHVLPDLPDRPAPSEVPSEVPREQPTTVRVRPGDSLWAIAEAELGPAATPARIAAYWPQIHDHNRHLVGADPDVIQPGQQLRLPPQ